MYREISDSIISAEKQDNNIITGHISFRKDFIGFNGHFDEKPVLSGICILEMIKCFLEKTLKSKFKFKEIVLAKFYNIITAEVPIEININIAEMNKGDRRAVKVLIAGEEKTNKAFIKLVVIEVGV